MFQIDLKGVCESVVKHELKRNTQEGKALYLVFDLGMSCFDTDNKFNCTIRRSLHLVYQVTPGYRYITVFSAVVGSPYAKLKNVTEWTHEVTHDSEWRSASIFHQLYFQMAGEINTLREAANLPSWAPADMHEYHRFQTDNLFEWVSADVRKDPDDPSSYRKVLVLT